MNKFIPGTVFLAGSAVAFFCAQWSASSMVALVINIGGSVIAFTVAIVMATLLGYEDTPPGIH